jgi:hypothetical protein
VGFWQEDQSERRKGNGRTFFLKIENIVQKTNNKPKNEGTLSVNKRTREHLTKTQTQHC